jgi:hypothetical protein
VAEKLEARGNRYLYEIHPPCVPAEMPNPTKVGHRVFMRAIKNIKPADEITYDYGRARRYSASF